MSYAHQRVTFQRLGFILYETRLVEAEPDWAHELFVDLGVVWTMLQVRKSS